MLWVLIRSASPFLLRNKKDISIFRLKKSTLSVAMVSDKSKVGGLKHDLIFKVTIMGSMIPEGIKI